MKKCKRRRFEGTESFGCFSYLWTPTEKVVFLGHRCANKLRFDRYLGCLSDAYWIESFEGSHFLQICHAANDVTGEPPDGGGGRLAALSNGKVFPPREGRYIIPPIFRRLLRLVTRRSGFDSHRKHGTQHGVSHAPTKRTGWPRRFGSAVSSGR